jgi:hypothetical protein
VQAFIQILWKLEFYDLEKNLFQFSYSMETDLFGNVEKSSFIGMAIGYDRNLEAAYISGSL